MLNAQKRTKADGKMTAALSCVHGCLKYIIGSAFLCLFIVIHASHEPRIDGSKKLNM